MARDHCLRNTVWSWAARCVDRPRVSSILYSVFCSLEWVRNPDYRGRYNNYNSYMYPAGTVYTLQYM